MNGKTLNLFIVDDNKLSLLSLKKSLNNRFGSILNISTFTTGKSALAYVDQDTSLVILDYNLDGEKGNEVLKDIKQINPTTKVIMLSSNEDVAIAIESFRNGATDYVVKGNKAWEKLVNHIYKKIVEPIRNMGREYSLKKLTKIFVGIFISMGILAMLLFIWIK
jgi:DNA-binding NtrC family response regulator